MLDVIVHQLIDILLHVVNLLPLAEIVYIPHHWWHSLRLYDPSALLCGHGSILVIIVKVIVAVIVNWQEGSYNIIIYLVFVEATPGRSTGFFWGAPTIFPQAAAGSRAIPGK